MKKKKIKSKIYIEPTKQSVVSILIGLTFVILVALLFYHLGSGKFYYNSKSTGNSLNLSINKPDDKKIETENNPKDLANYSKETILLNTVSQYYEFISKQQFKSAYDMLSKDYKIKEILEYDAFLSGYKTTKTVQIKEIQVNNPLINSIYVKINASDINDNRIYNKTYKGTWLLKLENGQWKLNSADIFQEI